MVISLDTPLLVGVYKDDILFHELSSCDHVSESLVKIIKDLSNRFLIQKIFYANGPGSFMGLKITYIILKTFSIIKKCDFYAVSGFEFSDKIRANKNFSFVLKQDDIVLEEIASSKPKLPKSLKTLNILQDTAPNYILDVI